MNLVGPDIYTLKVSGNRYSVISPDGRSHFIAPATTDRPKLYVVSRNSSLAYVGVSKQPLSSRLGGGMRATGEHGYHGYAWRKSDSQLRLDVWYLDGATRDNVSMELETIEAEVVHLFRLQTGQWPSDQTEIHFHPSSDFHRAAGQQILNKLKE